LLWRIMCTLLARCILAHEGVKGGAGLREGATDDLRDRTVLWAVGDSADETEDSRMSTTILGSGGNKLGSEKGEGGRGRGILIVG
jgi:hypothetical protein